MRQDPDKYVFHRFDENFKKINDYEGHQHRVTVIIQSQKNDRLISASRDRIVKTWDVETGACLSTFSDILVLPGDVIELENGNIAIFGYDHVLTIVILNMEDGSTTRKYPSIDDYITPLYQSFDTVFCKYHDEKDTLINFVLDFRKIEYEQPKESPLWLKGTLVCSKLEKLLDDLKSHRKQRNYIAYGITSFQNGDRAYRSNFETEKEVKTGCLLQENGRESFSTTVRYVFPTEREQQVLFLVHRKKRMISSDLVKESDDKTHLKEGKSNLDIITKISLDCCVIRNDVLVQLFRVLSHPENLYYLVGHRKSGELVFTIPCPNASKISGSIQSNKIYLLDQNYRIHAYECFYEDESLSNRCCFELAMSFSDPTYEEYASQVIPSEYYEWCKFIKERELVYIKTSIESQESIETEEVDRFDNNIK